MAKVTQPVTALVLSGSAGSGKTTQANVMSELLREANVGHAVIDLDELSRVWPFQPATFIWDNLASIWPTYVAVPTTTVVILPRLLDSEEDVAALRRATLGSRLVICELYATHDTCLERVTEREPNDYWRETLRVLVEEYTSRPPERRFGDFRVSTESGLERECALEILAAAGVL